MLGQWLLFLGRYINTEIFRCFRRVYDIKVERLLATRILGYQDLSRSEGRN